MWVDLRRNVSTFEYYYVLLRGGYYSKALGVLLNLSTSLGNVIHATDNWYEVLLNYPMLALKKKPVTVRLRDGVVRKVFRRSDVSKIVSEYFARQAVAKAKELYNVDLSFFGSEFTFVETFYYELYKDLEVKGKVVVDVGAYIGDTAIYTSCLGGPSMSTQLSLTPRLLGSLWRMLENWA